MTVVSASVIVPSVTALIPARLIVRLRLRMVSARHRLRVRLAARMPLRLRRIEIAVLRSGVVLLWPIIR